MQGQTTLVLASLFLAFFCVASGTTDVATRTALMEVKRDNVELKRDNAELKKDNTEFKRYYAEVKKDNTELKRDNAELKKDNTEFKRHYAEVKKDNAELKKDSAELKRDNAELKRDNAELKRDNAELKRHYAEVKRHYAELKRDNGEVKKEIADLRLLLTGGPAVQVRQSMTSRGSDNATTSGGGATYIRWGRTSCPAESKLVYKGYAGGSHYSHTGAATNHVCLPEDPQFPTTVLPPYYAEMYGAEYENNYVIFRSDIHDQDVPCSVCRSPTRSSAIMIPARTSCYQGLHQEYSGYLMAGWPGYNAGSEYICMDGDPETVHGGISNQNGDLFYFTASRCGSLKCPPYEDKRVLSCVVCSQ